MFSKHVCIYLTLLFIAQTSTPSVEREYTSYFKLQTAASQVDRMWCQQQWHNNSRRPFSFLLIWFTLNFCILKIVRKKDSDDGAKTALYFGTFLYQTMRIAFFCAEEVHRNNLGFISVFKNGIPETFPTARYAEIRFWQPASIRRSPLAGSNKLPCPHLFCCGGFRGGMCFLSLVTSNRS